MIILQRLLHRLDVLLVGHVRRRGVPQEVVDYQCCGVLAAALGQCLDKMLLPKLPGDSHVLAIVFEARQEKLEVGPPIVIGRIQYAPISPVI